MSLIHIEIGILAVLILCIICYIAILYRSERSYVSAWLSGWVLYWAAVVLMLCLPFNKLPSFPLVILHCVLIVASLLLFYGTNAFFNKIFYKIFAYCSLGIVAWMVLSHALNLTPSFYIFPGILLISVLDIINGIIWIKSPDNIISKRVSGWAFILLGIHHLDAPALYLNHIISPWGYLITLALSIIAILGTLQAYTQCNQKELRKSEKQFRLLAENANDLVYRYRLIPNPGYEYVSPSVIKFNGYTPEEHYADPNLIYKSVHPDDQYLFSLLGKYNNPKRIFWQRFVHKNGQVIMTEHRYEYLYDDYGTIVAIQGIIRDITERQDMEKQLEYISIHDYLTQIYNRSFFEAKLNQFEESDLIPIGIILCDIDGLKLVNDSMGYNAGDELLVQATRILKTCANVEDIVARIGGDEFAILQPKSSESQTGDTVDCIKKALDSYNLANPQSLLSLSIGSAVKKDSHKTLHEILKEADYNMNQEKLYRSRSIRSTIVRTLTNTLHERDYITEGHSDRLQDLVSKMGYSLRLSKSKIDDMRLFAHFHDIGKVGIPDRILLKPASLNEEERREMQKHAEIGFRLAQSAPELISISDWILKHHEWWNGKGYPLGISGEEIPLECRILSIADAYDAMISSRPYRDGMSEREALDELRRCAGSQFDPYLADKFIEIIQCNLADEPQLNRAL